ncbi:MAG: hypothetical protein QOH61_207 [Chloroflexota bacterium]|nr:hypothetical protein [Chloroflexota bacterium]
MTAPRGLTALLLAAAVALGGLACQGNVFSLKVGDCFNGGGASEVSDVTTVDCASPHDAEVYSVFDYPNAPSAYPGDDAIGAAADTRCRQDFAIFVGLSYDESIYNSNKLRPTSKSWESGDRTIDCLITSADGTQLTGSAKGTKK